jgi:hypothetical protein
MIWGDRKGFKRRWRCKFRTTSTTWYATNTTAKVFEEVFFLSRNWQPKIDRCCNRNCMDRWLIFQLSVSRKENTPLSSDKRYHHVIVSWNEGIQNFPIIIRTKKKKKCVKTYLFFNAINRLSNFNLIWETPRLNTQISFVYPGLFLGSRIEWISAYPMFEQWLQHINV